MGRFDSFVAPSPVINAAPLTVGTAGHVDHGKTRLVHALTGIETDRLPDEQSRGITIVLGFAPLALPSGRQLSLIDVPGHERLIRVMAAGAAGIDMFLLVIAADDGVMPQTLEHLRVLTALGVGAGVVAVTKSDLADPAPALRAAADLLPTAERIACSARTGSGVTAVSEALERVAGQLSGPTHPSGAVVLHVDRVFSINGAGTVVTGTLWSGTVTAGDRLELLPRRRTVRVRSVQVHHEPVAAAQAGQRVALNLAGISRELVEPGDTLIAPGAEVHVSHCLEVTLMLEEPLADGERVQIHHGTRDTPARAVHVVGPRWRIYTQRPLLATAGDRFVVRRISPPGTVGGGVIVTAAPRNRSPGQTVSVAALAPATAPDLAGDASAATARLNDQLRDAGLAPLSELRLVVERIVSAEGDITLARLRDELGTSRRHALAILQHFDDLRLTRRLADDRRVLRR